MSLFRTRTEQGALEGIDMGDYAVYKGIPYAKPPVGELRFCMPQRVENWIGVRMAKDNPPIAWQNRPEVGSFYEKEFYHEDPSLLSMSEDCLYLNIWTPAKQAEDRLPVMIWIHGGAFNHGFGHEREFDGRAYCERGVILVTVQYRLGIFGFLSHPWLEEGGNLALRDQSAAISWVYENIRYFGGDNRRITIAGQSAGGICVQAQLCNQTMKGKIHGAIMQSGGGYGQLTRRMESKSAAMERGKSFLRQCGITSREMLMKLDAKTMLDYANEYQYTCRIVCDSEIIPNRGEAVLYDQWDFHIPCLLGSNKNDIRVTQEMLERHIPSDLYVGNCDFAEKYGGGNQSFLYYFDRELPGDHAGAFHSAELWYMFGTLDRGWRPFEQADERLSEEMLECWSCFVKLGRPCKELSEWPQYERNEKFIRRFSVEK